MTPLISILLNSLDTNVLFRWMLMKPKKEHPNGNIYKEMKVRPNQH